MQTVFNFIRILTCVRIVLCPFKMCLVDGDVYVCICLSSDFCWFFVPVVGWFFCSSSNSWKVDIFHELKAYEKKIWLTLVILDFRLWCYLVHISILIHSNKCASLSHHVYFCNWNQFRMRFWWLLQRFFPFCYCCLWIYFMFSRWEREYTHTQKRTTTLFKRLHSFWSKIPWKKAPIWRKSFLMDDS